MTNPFAGGTERNKLFTYASSIKGNSDKASILFAEQMHGRGMFDVSGGTAVANTNLPKASAAVSHSAAGR